jgi:hypothetical protein
MLPDHVHDHCDGGEMIMRSLKRLVCRLCFVLLPVLIPSSSFALGWPESGDAGDLPATAQDTVGPPVSLDFISGTISTSLDKDMYKIEITNPLAFSATVVPGGSLIDSQLFLLNAAGSGVYANDDPILLFPDAILPAGHANGPVVAGTYYLAISGPDNDPTRVGGEIFDDINPGVQMAVLAGANDGWTNTFSVFGGTYTIDLTGAEFSNATGVPSLGAWGLALVAVVLGTRGCLFLRSKSH